MTKIPTAGLQGVLPGGSERAGVRLHPLCSGEVLIPPALLHRQTPLASARAIGVGLGKARRIWIPAPVFLIEHPSAGPVLIDTGLHPQAAENPRGTMGIAASQLYEFRVGHHGGLAGQLRARGLEPSAIKVVVMTHLHTDHASAITEFPQATFVVDGREWVAANRRPGFINGYRAQHFTHPYDWRLVDFSAADSTLAGFGSVVDLFGDCTVRLLPTPGHTPGHLSVLVSTGQREVLLTSDAAYTLKTIGDSTMPGIASNYRQFRDSLLQLQSYVAGQRGIVVIAGHDREQWPTLASVYD